VLGRHRGLGWRDERRRRRVVCHRRSSGGDHYGRVYAPEGDISGVGISEVLRRLPNPASAEITTSY